MSPQDIFHRLGDQGPVEDVSGWSNQVWLGRDHVVRVSSGRFAGAFSHELQVLSLLPNAVPHAEVLDYLVNGDGREVLVLRRLEGRPVSMLWPSLTNGQQEDLIRQFAQIVKQLHLIPVEPNLAPNWLVEALAEGGDLRSAYHPPPLDLPDILERMADVPGAPSSLLRDSVGYVRDRMSAFSSDERQVLVHADLHFHNVMATPERITGILDFEGSRAAPADLEVEWLARYCREPTPARPLSAAPEPGLLAWVVPAFREAYPALFGHPRLRERLEVYEVAWLAVQLMHSPLATDGLSRLLRGECAIPLLP